MSYRLAEAAAACSLNKATVRRAIKTGKVSATKDAHGQWHIEPGELHRVYPPRTEAGIDERVRAYISEVALLRERIEDLKTLTDEYRVWVRDLSEQRDRASGRHKRHVPPRQSGSRRHGKSFPDTPTKCVRAGYRHGRRWCRGSLL